MAPLAPAAASTTWPAAGRVTVTNSTFSGNSGGGFGGGIANYATMTVTNSTFSGNSATDGGGIYNDAGSLRLCVPGQQHYGQLAIGRELPHGECGLRRHRRQRGRRDHVYRSSGSLANTNPLLGPLANNGGPTQTMALGAGSPAINYVLKCTRAGTTDQRGSPAGHERGWLRQRGLRVHRCAAPTRTAGCNNRVVDRTESGDPVLRRYLGALADHRWQRIAHRPRCCRPTVCRQWGGLIFRRAKGSERLCGWELAATTRHRHRYRRGCGRLRLDHRHQPGR